MSDRGTEAIIVLSSFCSMSLSEFGEDGTDRSTEDRVLSSKGEEGGALFDVRRDILVLLFFLLR